ncbi:hypothetical protein B0J11DRAFT_478309 [Dendryphion nanum]|uniref:Uncharacterized protein n=1 Tax=Dendryphion nanum TaxID=256645 RepID=A0A9P9IWM5_9PLEO|nr:hypothetical protein B0J11DRAFT_478309 [Dendryphion nanum]
MSVTTTANPTTHNLHTVLANYDIHHSPSLEASTNSHPIPSPHPYPSSLDPISWPTDHRRVPAHRPVNTGLDQSERRVYQNGIERAFVTVMFTGVFTEATLAKMWRFTGGKIWDVGYKVGGEW